LCGHGEAAEDSELNRIVVTVKPSEEELDIETDDTNNHKCGLNSVSAPF